MELRRTAEALLRGQTGMLPFLAPALTRSHIARTQGLSLSRQTATYTQRQCLSTTVRRADNDKSRDESTRSPIPSDATDFLNAQLDGTKGVSTTSTGRTSRFKSTLAQAANRVQQPPGSNAPASPSNAPSSFPFKFRQAAPTKPDIPQLLKGLLDSSKSDFSRNGTNYVSEMMDPLSKLKPNPNRPRDLPAPLPIPLGPSLGRTVQVNNTTGMDVGRAIKTLEIQCARNKVRADSQRQRFHERPGLKRKRLRSERWRRTFKEGFRGLVKVVGEMRKQGW